jgi:CRISPR/Cas system type I-B associated protein Csh2 (Cas7 group RAMP superfamily)
MSNFNRATGLLIIEVRGSNPNGDPDAEGEPRTLGADRRGLISPVSFKRKLRDLIEGEAGPIWEKAKQAIQLDGDGRSYGILESRDRDRGAIFKLGRDDFIRAYWDARVFGNTFLESLKTGADEEDSDKKPKGGKGKSSEKEHFISVGAVQFGPGVSIAPVEIEYQTWTNKAGVQEGKDRGMAPLAWRFVRHAIYTMPFFVNPLVARKGGCSASDVDLMKFLIPLAYSATASVARPNVAILHAWYAEHNAPLGSCPDHRIIDAMTPKKLRDPDQPSSSVAEYDIPTKLPDELRDRLASFEDLCTRDWNTRLS